MKGKFDLEYERIILINLLSIEYFEEFKDFEPLAEEVANEINIIFDKLRSLKRDKVFKDKDILIIYRLIYNEIWRLNDLLYKLNSFRLAENIYEVIYNIFEELMVLCADFEQFEMAQNLYNVKAFWFEQIDVKTIINEGAKR